MHNVTQVVMLGVASLVGVTLLIPLVRAVALSYGFADQPRSDRLHRQPTPYLGGVAIVLTACAAVPFLREWHPEAAAILFGAVVLAVVGLIDDVRSLRPLPRLAAEVGAALLAASAGARVFIFDNPIDWVLTVVWLVVVTNAFNLLDNMDGAAGIIATTSATALVIAAVMQDQVLVGGLGAVIAGSCIGFLLYNWHPARIFMGDSGSLFLGYVLAVIALKLRFPVDHPASISSIVLLTGPALFDTTLVVISRTSKGLPIYVGGTDHTAHRLLRIGLSTRTVAMLLAAACALCCGLGVGVGRGFIPAGATVSAATACAAVLLVWLLRLPSTDAEAAEVAADVSTALSPSAAAGGG